MSKILYTEKQIPEHNGLIRLLPFWHLVCSIGKWTFWWFIKGAEWQVEMEGCSSWIKAVGGSFDAGGLRKVAQMDLRGSSHLHSPSPQTSNSPSSLWICFSPPTQAAIQAPALHCPASPAPSHLGPSPLPAGSPPLPSQGPHLGSTSLSPAFATSLSSLAPLVWCWLHKQKVLSLSVNLLKLWPPSVSQVFGKGCLPSCFHVFTCTDFSPPACLPALNLLLPKSPVTLGQHTMETPSLGLYDDPKVLDLGDLFLLSWLFSLVSLVLLSLWSYSHYPHADNSQVSTLSPDCPLELHAPYPTAHRTTHISQTCQSRFPKQSPPHSAPHPHSTSLMSYVLGILSTQTPLLRRHSTSPWPSGPFTWLLFIL